MDPNPANPEMHSVPQNLKLPHNHNILDSILDYHQREGEADKKEEREL